MSYSKKPRRGDKRKRTGDQYVCGICYIRFDSKDNFIEHAVYTHGDNM